LVICASLQRSQAPLLDLAAQILTYHQLSPAVVLARTEFRMFNMGFAGGLPVTSFTRVS
jgi:hypothetical protein